MVSIDSKLDVKKVIRLMADYVMLNSVATDSTSLFYGRAGMCVCLFETARFLEDDFMEEYAFQLLQQSLLNEKNDIRLTSGLSGIGYALSYLIRNKFVDADFFEVFQRQHNIIVDGFLRDDISNMKLKDIITLWDLMPYFYFVPDSRVSQRVGELHSMCIHRFRKIWKALEKSHFVLDKEIIIVLWRRYLKMLCFTGNDGSLLYIEEYLNLVQKGILRRDFQSVYYVSCVFSRCKKFSCDIQTPVELCKELNAFYLLDSQEIGNLFSDSYLSYKPIKEEINKIFEGKTACQIKDILNGSIGFSCNSSLSFGLSKLILVLLSTNINDDCHIVKEVLSILS